MAGHAGDVAGVRAGDGLQDEKGVFDGARHGAKLVERPAERHRAGAWDAAVGGGKAGAARAHGGADDAAAGFAADGEADESRGGGGAGAGAGAGRAFIEQPGVHGLTAKPNVVERERAEAELGDKYGTGAMEALDDGGILRGDAITERLGAVGCGD